MLFAGWKVRIVKNCDRGLENAARGRRPRAAFSSPRSQFFTIRTDPKPVNILFIFFPSLKRLCFYSRHTHASVTVTVVRDRKIRTALRTNQIAEFVTVTAWGKINICYLPGGRSVWEKTVPEVLSTARRRRPRAVPKTKGTVFPIRTSRPVNNMFIFFPVVAWLYRLQMGLFTQLLSFNGLARRLPTICKKSSQRTSNSDSRQKKDVRTYVFRTTLC